MKLRLLFCVQVWACMCPMPTSGATIMAMKLSGAVGLQSRIPSAGVVSNRYCSWSGATSSHNASSPTSSTSALSASGALQERYTIISMLRSHLVKLQWCSIVCDEIRRFLRGIWVLVHLQQVVVCWIKLQLPVSPLVSPVDNTCWIT